MNLRKALWIGVLALLLALSPASDMMPATVSTVQAAPTKLNYPKKNLLVGETFTLKLKTGKATSFKSSNKSVATVSKKGKVIAKSPGDVKITVTTKAGKKYSCKVSVRNQVDFIIFAGQSNMTNVGKASEAPAVKDGAAYEVLLTKKKLSPLGEPFGVQQKGKVTKSSGGTLASAFANAYYNETGIPIVATSTASPLSDSVTDAGMPTARHGAERTESISTEKCPWRESASWSREKKIPSHCYRPRTRSRRSCRKPCIGSRDPTSPACCWSI